MPVNRFLLLLITLLLTLFACRQAPDTSPLLATLPTVTTGVTETAVTTALPSITPLSIAPSPTPPPSATPTTTSAPPTATTTPTPPEPTATITGLIGPYEFPPDINPLTGLVVPDPARLARRPLAIKISNAPAIVRPQTGLNSADLIFEHLAEGGFTRFTAIFYSKDAAVVGSIRSGRLIDLEIPQMYDAAFAYSGSSGPVRLMFHDSSFFTRIISPDFAHGGFFRVADADKAVEHTLFTNTSNLRFILGERGEDTPPQFQNGMTFRDTPPFPGVLASQLVLYYPSTVATWSYDGRRYLRWTDGEPHFDAATNSQLSFKNIVVIAAHHEETDIIEDNGGNFSLQIQIWGDGPVSVFRDGQRIDGRWQRHHPDDMLTFSDLQGNVLPLAPGNTFFQLVPLGFDQLNSSP